MKTTQASIHPFTIRMTSNLTEPFAFFMSATASVGFEGRLPLMPTILSPGSKPAALLGLATPAGISRKPLTPTKVLGWVVVVFALMVVAVDEERGSPESLSSTNPIPCSPSGTTKLNC